MKYSIKEIAQILHIKPSALGDDKASVSYLLTDSRSLTFPEETLFFAIRTGSNDGHRYIASLYEKGVRNFVVETLHSVPQELGDANFLVVPDTLSALHAIASYHRRRFSIPVIGITGSRGKTWVKEWLYQLLKDDYRIVRSPRSFNSKIGVPLSLWEIDDNTSLAIIEAGISQPGEMATLQDMIRPTIGVFTCLGREHSEGFPSKALKAQEKASLFTACDCIVYNHDDAIIASTMEPIASIAQDISWSRTDPEAPLLISDIDRHDNCTHIAYTYMGVPAELDLPFVDDADIDNAVCCLAVIAFLGLSPDTIAERMARLTRVGTRLNVIEGVNDCLVIADSYTSDFNSLAPALDFVSRRSTPMTSTTVILSDVMHEAMPTDAVYEHVAELLAHKNVSRIIGIGSEISKYAHLFGNDARFFPSTSDFLAEMSPSDFENELILVKGAPEFLFSRITDMLEAKQHQTVLEVNLDALVHNYNFFRSRITPPCRIVCMVKASGYGAGSYELAKTLQDAGAAYLAVAVHDEGVDLRRAGISMPIMVLNPGVVNYKAMFSYRLEPEVFSIEACRQLIHEAEKYGITDYPVHIKLDTGMHRLGFIKEQLPELVKLLRSQDAIKPVTVFSHLCVADEPAQDDYTRGQFGYFDECCAILQSGFTHHIKRHILNTTGIVRFPEQQNDLVRLGIGLYGIATTSDGSESTLKPVSSLHTVIISIKEWPAGTTIGYGRRGLLSRLSRIATIPVGYADGIDRHFGNGAISMWVNGHRCPTVGNICMDVCIIDVTDIPCKVGDHVEIFGQHIPVEELAAVRGTIPYEILTSISNRVKRVYFRE